MIQNEEVRRQSERILALIEKAENSFEEGDELQAHLAKYICVLCSGFLENAIQLIYGDYVKSETESEAVILFSTKTLSKIQNPNSEKFRETAKSFRPDWEESLKQFLQEEERGSAINYIMKDRHRIAHGKDSEITLNRIKGYLIKTIEVLEFIERQCELVEE